jgi:pyruvate formate lyase activating enzyme
VHRGVNDSPEELRALVGWMRDALGPQVPWHVLPGDAGAETAAAVARARRIGHEGGLQFIYGPEPNQETRCPSCQATLITRDHKVTRTLGLTDESCASCGARIYVRTSIFKRR